jgi:hypothetical protein
MFADTLEAGLFAYHHITSSEYKENWITYCQHALRNSPTLTGIVRAYPFWWSALNAIMPGDITIKAPLLVG